MKGFLGLDTAHGVSPEKMEDFLCKAAPILGNRLSGPQLNQDPVMSRPRTATPAPAVLLSLTCQQTRKTVRQMPAAAVRLNMDLARNQDRRWLSSMQRGPPQCPKCGTRQWCAPLGTTDTLSLSLSLALGLSHSLPGKHVRPPNSASMLKDMTR